MRSGLLTGSMVLPLLLVNITRAEDSPPAAPPTAANPAAQLTLHADQPGHAISPLLYGVFFEDVSHAGDGGLYAEMLRNRSFEDAPTPEAWTLSLTPDAAAEMTLDSAQPLNEHNPHALKLAVRQIGAGPVGVTNAGFKGVAVRQSAEYRLTLYARCGDGADGAMNVRLHSADGRRVYAEQHIQGLNGEWRQFEATLTPSHTDPDARFSITVARAGTYWFDMVSLFPKAADKHRQDILRADLAQFIAELQPAFLRFPGGCFVEGDKIANAWRWKATLGDPAQRPGHWNLWRYRSTDGLGYHEYLQMCADVGAEPLFVINCGMAHENVVPMNEMGPWVQDALDAIEYANGPAESTWGRRRAEAGHPEPFNLKLVEIGNENGGREYNERYALFYDAIKAKYPEVRLIADVWGNGHPTSRPVEILDEHYYADPAFFWHRATMYDRYDRQGPKIYVGEYAVTQQCGLGNLAGAVAEAAFMTGMERNSDVVIMASYAPLFAQVHFKNWNPNAINFDAARAYGTPSYYVQKLFAAHRADILLPVEVQAPHVELTPLTGRIGLGTWDTQAEFKDVRVTQGDQVLFASDFSSGLKGWKSVRGQWTTEAGALRQTSDAREARIVVGDADWGDYTLALKARKLGGSEGFLILFRSNHNQAKMWWNLGGWGNTLHGVETPQGIVEPRVRGQIETGKWYDIRIELKGPSIRCYLDGQLIHDLAPTNHVPSLYAVAGRSIKQNDVILKVVNIASEPRETELDIQGMPKLAASASATVLTSASPDDENSLDEPTKVAPATRELPVSGPRFRHMFPPHSVTILRFRTATGT